MATYGPTLRRGLPRRPDGEPWPAASAHSEAAGHDEITGHPSHPVPVFADGNEAGPGLADADADAAVLGSTGHEPELAPGMSPQRADAEANQATQANLSRTRLRRGLPRVVDGEPWPPVGYAPEGLGPPSTPHADRLTCEARGRDGAGARRRAESLVAPKTRQSRSRIRTIVVGAVAIVAATAVVVLLVRWLLGLDPVREFVTTYPGEYALPDSAPVGIPAWLAWQHFVNVFFMVLIIRTGIQIRTEQRPQAHWAPRAKPTARISLTVWFHQALDLLWLLNGLVFLVLLVSTGQWMRVVPTSGEVFPHALSAALQYLSLDWPTENGWAHYNALQQLAYFTTIFVAAPLAAVSGLRMSSLWPMRSARLSAAFPVEWARGVHFPVMLYFVVFIVIHVALVLSTGALRNLNHMYAAQGSLDPGEFAQNWTGFWIFAASIAFIALAWVAARPIILAPIARLFGNVSGR